MAEADDLTYQSGANDERRAALRDAEPASLLARLIEVENAVRTNAAQGEVRDKKQNADERLLDRVKTAERWMIGITILIFLVSVFQAYESWSNNGSTGKQVERIIDATNRMDDAADSFSTSSANMSRRMNDAVDQLGEQAKATRNAAESAATQTAIARSSLHIGNDPILIVPSETLRRLNLYSVRFQPNRFSSPIEYTNLGRTPAISVIATTIVDIYGDSALPPIPLYDGLSGDVIAAGGTKSANASVLAGNNDLNQLQGVGSERSGFSILGYIQYKDLFEKKHITAFCNFYPFNPGPGNTPRQCKSGNWFEHPPK